MTHAGVLLVLATLFPAAHAAEDPGTSPSVDTVQAVPLDEVLASVDRALPLLRAAQAKVDEAAAKRMGAFGWLDPTLQAKGGARFGSYRHDYGQVTLSQATPLLGLSIEGGWRIGDGDFPAYDTTVQTGGAGELFAAATLPLLQGGWMDDRRAKAMASDAALAQAQAKASADRVKLRFAARKAWASWMAAGASLRLAEDLLQLAEQTGRAARALASAGSASDLDVLDAERAVLERSAVVQTARRDLADAAYTLGLYWRDGEGRPRDLAGWRPPAVPDLPDALPPVDLGQVLEEARRTRPEVSVMAASVRAVEAELKLARVEVLPTLDLTGGVERDLPVAGGDDPVTDAKVGATLKVPLALRKGRGGLMAAQARRTMVLAEQGWLLDQIDAEVRTALVDVDTAWQRARDTARAATLSRQIADGTRTAWQQGARDLLDVWVRDQKRFEADTKAIKAWKDWFVADAGLLAARGSP